MISICYIINLLFLSTIQKSSLCCSTADYHMMTGESLPYRKFGFSSVEAFIRNIPDITVTNKNGELYVDALPSKSTAHLTKLISHQVSKQKTRRKPQAKRVIIH